MIALREFTAQDAPEIINILNDQQVTEYLSSKIPFPYTQNDANGWINHGSKIGIIKAIEIDGQCVGCIGITPGEFEYSRSGEIGYWLNPKFWGQGIITHAISLICEKAFNTSELNRIFATVFSGNSGSEKALIKAGFSLEAQLKQAIYKNNQFYDSIILSLLKNHKHSTK